MRHAFSLKILVAVVVAALLPAASSQAGFCDCLFGRSTTAQTTYAPPYAPAPVVPVATVAPACSSCQTCPSCTTVVVPSCTTCTPSCATCVPSCATCAPQTCQMPSVVYRALYPAAPACGPCGSYAAYAPVTTYRPFFGTYETRYVPYTTYWPARPAVVSYGCSTCPTCATCNSCASGACGSTILSAPVSSPLSTTIPAPASACPSCAASAAVAPAVPSPSMSAPALPPNGVIPPATYPSQQSVAPSNNAAPKTFQEQTNKPAIQPEVKPIPQPENAKPSSLPAPTLRNPNDRTASRPVYSAARVELVAKPAQPPLEDDGGWHAAKQ